jgi:hypothetical protein
MASPPTPSPQSRLFSARLSFICPRERAGKSICRRNGARQFATLRYAEGKLGASAPTRSGTRYVERAVLFYSRRAHADRGCVGRNEAIVPRLSQLYRLASLEAAVVWRKWELTAVVIGPELSCIGRVNVDVF